MIKKSIYPKTNRICNNEITYEITEKIDDSCPHTRDFSRELGHA